MSIQTEPFYKKFEMSRKYQVKNEKREKERETDNYISKSHDPFSYLLNNPNIFKRHYKWKRRKINDIQWNIYLEMDRCQKFIFNFRINH
jgi:hypothetical protein